MKKTLFVIILACALNLSCTIQIKSDFADRLSYSLMKQAETFIVLTSSYYCENNTLPKSKQDLLEHILRNKLNIDLSRYTSIQYTEDNGELICTFSIKTDEVEITQNMNFGRNFMENVDCRKYKNNTSSKIIEI